MKHFQTFENFSRDINEGAKDHTPQGIEDSIVSGIADWVGFKNTDIGKLIYNDRNAQSALKAFVKAVKPILDSK